MIIKYHVPAFFIPFWKKPIFSQFSQSSWVVAFFTAFALLLCISLQAQENNAVDQGDIAEKDEELLEEFSSNLEKLGDDATTTSIQQTLYLQLQNYQQRTLVKDFTFFFGFSTGISAFPIASFKKEVKAASEKLVEDLNFSRNEDEEQFQLYQQVLIPPFYFSLDFRFFYKFLGFGTSYDYFVHTFADYRVSFDEEPESAYSFFKDPVEYQYRMSGHGMGFYTFIRRSIYVPQVQVIFGLGYTFNVANLEVSLNGGTNFNNRSANYKKIGHGLRGMAELLVVYKYFTYGFGVMIDSTSFSEFSNSEGSLTNSDGEKIKAGLLNSPFFYFRIGTRF